MVTVYDKLSIQAVQSVAKQTEAEVSKPLQGDSPFKKMLDSLDTGTEMAGMLGIGKDTQLAGPGMQTLSAEQINFDPSSTKVGLAEPQGASKIVDMLSEVNKGQMQMDNVVNEILYSGKRFNNQELLAIQAHVFHFAQMTELTVKVAEQGVSSVKTVLNTQIQ